jgi:hypothetical protein
LNCKIKKEWIEIEKEHTNSTEKAKKIVKDHLAEYGCEYYPELIKLTRRLK